MIISGFFRCTCGKLHTVGGLSFTSKCKCSRNLWDERFRNNRASGHKKTFG